VLAAGGIGSARAMAAALAAGADGVRVGTRFVATAESGSHPAYMQALVEASAAARPSVPVTQLLAAKGTRPIRSLDELAADTFESDEELEEFLAFTYAERHRDLA
jgi:NAD(P)H-dependent flavin oxidoreductase YrpB (nitropropane dioxygenase family)